MLDPRIDFGSIERSFGCDNCKHDSDGLAGDYCEYCSPDYSPPSKYRPAHRTIQEKVYYDKYDKITYEEYLRFIKTGR